MYIYPSYYEILGENKMFPGNLEMPLVMALSLVWHGYTNNKNSQMYMYLKK